MMLQCAISLLDIIGSQPQLTCITGTSCLAVRSSCCCAGPEALGAFPAIAIFTCRSPRVCTSSDWVCLQQMSCSAAALASPWSTQQLDGMQLHIEPGWMLHLPLGLERQFFHEPSVQQ
jgi:hypothetical protein